VRRGPVVDRAVRRGARAVGLDLSIRQLAHARRLAGEASERVPFVNANAERTPFADASFDVVFCDHGAMTFADPYPHGARGRPAPSSGRGVRVQHREPADLALLG
jgi:Methylase involved in ubiquinone/menaquinone biosynthesis